MSDVGQSGHSAACCTIPPVVRSGYAAQGRYEDVGGRHTYVTGPDGADKAILYVMDIFGYYEQSLQGADIIAKSDPANQYQVFIPNFYAGGTPASLEWYTPGYKEKDQKLGEFFKANPPQKVAGIVPDTIKAIQAQYPRIKSWGIVGFCWGGKITTLSVQHGQEQPFSAAAICHPAMVDPKDAPAVSVPFALLASKDENAEHVQEFSDNLKAPKFVETYADQTHGWMAARSNLSDDKVKQEYERGYKTVVEWFGKHMG